MSGSNSNSQGSTLALVSWVIAVATFLAVAIKLGTKIVVTKRVDLSMDSIFVLGALVFAAGQTGALTIAVQNGLGENISMLSGSDIRRYQQATYAANELYISALCMAKLSSVAFFFKSTLGRAPRMMCIILGSVIALWGFISVFALGFQCSLPNPWLFLETKCFNRKDFWYFAGTMDVLTDLCLLLLPFYTLKALNISQKRRYEIIAPFCVRVFVVPVTVLRLVYLSSSLNSADPTFNDFRPVLTTIIQMNLSIIVSCAPFTKFVVSGVQSGLLTSNLRVLAPSYAGTHEYSKSSSTRKSKRRSELGSSSRSTAFTTTTMTHISRNSLEGESRMGSPIEPEPHVIRQTIEWAVDFDKASPESLDNENGEKCLV